MKNKMFVLGTVLALGTLGSITAFAATSSGTSSTPTKAISSTSHFHRRFGKLTDVASILGIDEARLRSDLAAGQSLAQIANSKGISEDTLIADLKSDLQKKLDQVVQNGKLTGTQEQSILDKFSAQAKEFVEHAGGFNGGLGHGKGHFRGAGIFKDVAQVLGIDEATLRKDVAAGQSLVQIAKSKGISEDTLISDLKSDLQKKLDQAVKNGKLTTQQKQNILDKFNAHAAQLVERTGGFDKSSHGHHHDMDGNGTSSDSNA